MKIEKAILNNLICAKYLFFKGVKTLSQKNPFSAGFALLNFQDSVEMILRVIARQIGCNKVKENEGFDSLISLINTQSGKEMPYKMALTQMNKARVSFKHFGNAPKEEDVQKFSIDLEYFFPEALRLFLDVDFNTISLADLIEHKRTENYLKKAELFIEDKDYMNTIKQVAIAFEIYYAHHTAFIKDFSNFNHNTFLRFDDHNENHEKKVSGEERSKKQLLVNNHN